MSVGNHHACTQVMPTSVHDLKVNADLLASTFIYTRSPDLLATQRVLIGITACLHSIVKIVRHGDNSVVVGRSDTTGAQTRAVVRQLSSEMVSIRGQRQESRTVTDISICPKRQRRPKLTPTSSTTPPRDQ